MLWNGRDQLRIQSWWSVINFYVISKNTGDFFLQTAHPPFPSLFLGTSSPPRRESCRFPPRTPDAKAQNSFSLISPRANHLWGITELRLNKFKRNTQMISLSRSPGQKLSWKTIASEVHFSRFGLRTIHFLSCCSSGDFSAPLQLQLRLLDISSESQRHLHVLKTSGRTRLKWRVYQCMPGYSVLEDAWWTGLKSFRGRRGFWEFRQLEDVSVLYDVFLKSEGRRIHVMSCQVIS